MFKTIRSELTPWNINKDNIKRDVPKDRKSINRKHWRIVRAFILETVRNLIYPATGWDLKQ